jgi:hypothetical protein
MGLSPDTKREIRAALLQIVLVVLTSFGSKILNGKWFYYLSRVPIFVWIIWPLLFILFMWMRRKTKSSQQVAVARSSFGFLSPSVDLGYYDFQGLKWRVATNADIQILGQRWPHSLDADEVFVHKEACCPVCQTELKERIERNWFRECYIWTCPRGDFSMKSADNMSSLAYNLEKIIQADIRMGRFNPLPDMQG